MLNLRQPRLLVCAFVVVLSAVTAKRVLAQASPAAVPASLAETPSKPMAAQTTPAVLAPGEPTSQLPAPPAVELTVPRELTAYPQRGQADALVPPVTAQPQNRPARQGRSLIAVGVGMISASIFHALVFGRRHACDRSPSLSRAVRYGSILSASIGLGFVIGGGVRLGFAKHEGAGPPTRTQIGTLPALATGAAALTEALLFTSYELVAAGVCD